MKIDRYFNIAKSASKLSDHPKINIGACIVYKKQVLAIGYNSLTTHPIQKDYNKYRSDEHREFDVDRQLNGLHAEMSVLIATRHMPNIDWSKATMFVYRKGVGSCKPCEACTRAIRERGIVNVYYTENEEWIRMDSIGKEKLNDKHNKIAISDYR